MKIVCYGDSNTYGWDPREFSGNHYDHPWPEAFAEMTGHEVVNLGVPGRTVPSRKEYREWFVRDVQAHDPDLLIIMLGTNDILDMDAPDATEPAENMRAMIRTAKANDLAKRIMILSVPDTALDYRPYSPAIAELAKKYREIAAEEGVEFADPYSWNIPMAYDLTHFSERGHILFAEKISEAVAGISG